MYYQPDPECPFISDLQGLIAKTVGLIDVLREFLRPFEKRIACAFVYGSVTLGEEISDSDIDLMVIGQATRFELVKGLQEAEQQLARPVNVLFYKAHEFAKKVVMEEHFLSAVLRGQKLFVIGDKHDLERARKTTTGRKRDHKQV